MNERLHGRGVARARLLVAYIGEDDDLAHVARAALRLGAEHGARVILYDRDAASALSDPWPNQWGSHRTEIAAAPPAS